MASTATTDHDTATIPAATLEEILLGTAQDDPARAGLPALPDGWQHAAVVQRLADAPPVRREGLLAMGFGLVALLWAPLGILAVISGTERTFLTLSLLAALLVVAPRPTGVASAFAGIADRLRPAAARAAAGAGTAATTVRREATPWLRRAGAALAHATAVVRERVTTWVAEFRAAGERAGRVSAPSGLSDPLSRWVDGQSTPSSTR